MRLRSGRVVSKTLVSQKEIEAAETLCAMRNRKITPNHYQKFRNGENHASQQKTFNPNYR